jgi:two-component system, OmpR family, phosphate regulon sensor histidine kinase PhoR
MTTMPEPGAAELLSAYPHAAVLVDRAGNIHALNARAQQHFPMARAGEPASFAFRDPQIHEALQRAARSEASRFGITERHPVERAFDVHAAPTSEGYVLAVFEDLTERRKLERMRVDFIANASHELRTPLASVLGFLETLKGPARHDPVASARFLGIMEDQAQRMARLVDDLLSLSRIELQSHVRPRDKVVLQDAARQIIDGLRKHAADNGATLSFEAPQEPLAVLGDRDELLRVFENLIENAVRYGGGKVLITVGRRGAGEAFASVRDEGPGIAPEHLPRLTERFYRADAAASRQRGGTGLGLAIVKHIMLRHRGRLEIDSTLGAGSTFTIRLDTAE